MPQFRKPKYQKKYDIICFHKLRQEIKRKDKSELSKIELSYNDSNFVIAYGNYIEHRNHQ